MAIILRLQNLPWTASSADIRKFFTGVSIPDGGVHIVGGELGDVFIAFSTDDDARQAFGMTNQPLCGSKVSLMLSSKNEMMDVIAKNRAAAQKDPIFSPTAGASPSQVSAVPKDQKAQAPAGDEFRQSMKTDQSNSANYPLSSVGRQPLTSTPASRPTDAPYEGYGNQQWGNQQYGNQHYGYQQYGSGSQQYADQPYGGQAYGTQQAEEPSTSAGGSFANSPAASQGYSGQQPLPSGQQPLPSGQQPLLSGQQPLPSGQQPLPSGQPKDPYAPVGEAPGGQPVPGRSAEPQDEPPKRDRSRWDIEPGMQRAPSRWDQDPKAKSLAGQADPRASRISSRDVPAPDGRDRSREREKSKDREHVRDRDRDRDVRDRDRDIRDRDRDVRDRDRDVRDRQRSQGYDERVREDRPSSRQSSHSSGIQGLDSALEAYRQPSFDRSNTDSPLERSNKRPPLLDSPLLESTKDKQPQMSKYGQQDQPYNTQGSSLGRLPPDRQGPNVGQTVAETPGFAGQQSHNGRGSRWGPPKETLDPNVGKPSDTPGSSAAQFQLGSTLGQGQSTERSEAGMRQPFEHGHPSDKTFGVEGYNMQQEQPYGQAGYNNQPLWSGSDRDQSKNDTKITGRRVDTPEIRDSTYNRPDDNQRPYFDRSDNRGSTQQRPNDYRDPQFDRQRPLLGNLPHDRQDHNRRELLNNPNGTTKKSVPNQLKSLLDLPDIQPTKAMQMGSNQPFEKSGQPVDRSETTGIETGPRSTDQSFGDDGYDQQMPSQPPKGEQSIRERPGLLGQQPSDKHGDSGFNPPWNNDRKDNRPFNNPGLLGDQPFDRYSQNRGDGQGRDRDNDFGSRGRFQDDNQFEDPYFQRESSRFNDPRRQGLLMPPEGGRFGEPAAPQGGFDPGRRLQNDSPDEDFVSMTWPTTDEKEEAESGRREDNVKSSRRPLLGDAPGVPHGGIGEHDRTLDRSKSDIDTHQPPNSMNMRGPPLDTDNRGRPFDMDGFGTGSNFSYDREPRQMGNKGSRYDMDRPESQNDMNRFAATSNMDRHGGESFQMDTSGSLPSDMDRQGGPPFDMDRREGPPIDIDRRSGRPSDMDGRGGSSFNTERRGGPPLEMDRHGGMPSDKNRHGGLQSNMGRRDGQPIDMDRRGGLQSDMDEQGGSFNMDGRSGSSFNRDGHSGSFNMDGPGGSFNMGGRGGSSFNMGGRDGSSFNMDGRGGSSFDMNRPDGRDGSSFNMDGRGGSSFDMNRPDGLPSDMDRPGGLMSDIDGRGGSSFNMDGRGGSSFVMDRSNRQASNTGGYDGSSSDMDGRGGLPSDIDNRGGQPFNMDRTSGPQSDWNRSGGPPSNMDRRGGQPFDMDKRGGPPFDMDKRGGPPFDMDRQGGPPFDMDRRGRPPYDMDRCGGPQFDMERQDGPMSDKDRLGGPQHDINMTGPSHERGGPSPHGMNLQGPPRDIDRRGPLQQMGNQGSMPEVGQGQILDKDLHGPLKGFDKQASTVDIKLFDKKDELEETCVRLVGLPYNTTSQDINQFFAGLRIAQDGIKLGKDDRGQIKGEGFVKLASNRDCLEAIKRNRNYIGRRFIQVYLCSENEWINAGSPNLANKPKSSSPSVRKSQSPSKSSRSPSRRGRSPPKSSTGRGHSPKFRSRGQSPSRSRGSSPGRSTSNSRGYSGRGRRSRSRSPIRDSTTCLVLKGLSTDTKEKDITDFLRGISVVPGSVFLECSEDGKPTGHAYVRLANQKDMRLALDKDGRSIGRRRITVRDIATKIMQSKVGEMQRIARVLALKEKKQQQELKATQNEQKKPQQSSQKTVAKEGSLKNQQTQKAASKPSDVLQKPLKAVPSKPELKPQSADPKQVPSKSADISKKVTQKQEPKQSSVVPKPVPKQPPAVKKQEVKQSPVVPKQGQKQSPVGQKQEGKQSPIVPKPEPKQPPVDKKKEAKPLLSTPNQPPKPLPSILDGQKQQSPQQPKKGLLPLPTDHQTLSNHGPKSGAGDKRPEQEETDINARNCIHVHNLPFHVSENEVLNFFRDLDIIPPGLVFMLNPDGSPSGHAYMAVSSPVEAGKAAERRQGLIRGRKIVINIVPRYAMLQAIGLGHTISQPLLGAGSQGNGPPGNGPQGIGASVGPNISASTHPRPNGNQSTPSRKPLMQDSPQSPDGLHPIPLPPLAVMVEQRRIVEATNLPFDVSVAGVVEFFQKYGVIPESVRFKNGPGGKPMGAAIAAFSTPQNAQKAIQELTNKPIVGRTGSSRSVRLHLLNWYRESRIVQRNPMPSTETWTCSPVPTTTALAP